MVVELVEPRDGRWKRLCETADPDTYQVPEWTELSALIEHGQPCGLYGECSGGEFLIPLIVRDLPKLGDNSLAGWRDAVSPYGYPGVLAHGDFDSEANLGERIRKALREHRILACFVRMNPMRSMGAAIAQQLGICVDAGETVFYDLTLDETVLWKQTRREHRRDIEDLRAVGYRTRVDEWADYAAFKSLYLATMRRVGAQSYYLFDEAYFDTLPHVLGDRLHIVSAVAPGGLVMSAGLFLAAGAGTAHAYLSGNSSDTPHASKLVYDAAWRWHQARGAKSLHMGGGLGRPNDSLLNFKRGLAKGRRRFQTLRVVSVPDRYCAACIAAGEDPKDLTGFFPPYRRRAVNEIKTPSRPTEVSDEVRV